MPGTGKTKTLVEAICQISRINPTNRILVCATSNAAANEITVRLLKNLQNNCYFEHNVYRLFAVSAMENVTEPELKRNSNYSLGHFPSLTFLIKFRIVISTLVGAGQLLAADIKSSHFTHLFIDECGSATEAAALIPIAGNHFTLIIVLN